MSYSYVCITLDVRLQRSMVGIKSILLLLSLSLLLVNVSCKKEKKAKPILLGGFREMSQVAPAHSDACQFKRGIVENVLTRTGCNSWAPINPAHFPIQVDPAVGYTVIDLGFGVKLLYEGAYFIIVVETNTGKAILIDAAQGNWGTQDASRLIAALEASFQPIGTMVYSHSHLDHIGFSGAVIDHFNVQNIVCHENANNDILASFNAGDTRRRPCTTIIQGPNVNYTLTVSNQTLELSHFEPNGHGHGNMFIYHALSKTVILIDVIVPSWTPFAALSLADSGPGYYLDILRLLKFDFVHFVGGHLTKVGTRQDVEVCKQHHEDLQTGAMLAIAGPDAVDFNAVVNELQIFTPGTENFLNIWVLYRTYLYQAVSICQKHINRIWTPLSDGNRGSYVTPVQISGADVWARENCWATINFLRLDGVIPTPVQSNIGTNMGDKKRNMDDTLIQLAKDTIKTTKTQIKSTFADIQRKIQEKMFELRSHVKNQ